METHIYIASDHAGFALKTQVISEIRNSFPKIQVHDLGPQNEERVDYPDFANLVAQQVNAGKGQGVLICGSGQGMVIRANRYPQVRAALCWNEESCALAREHNDANVLCLGARLISEEIARRLIHVFLNTSFAEGRHAQRVKKLSLPPCS